MSTTFNQVERRQLSRRLRSVISQYATVLFAGSVLIFHLDDFRGKPDIVFFTGLTFLIAVFLPLILCALTRIPGFYNFRWIPTKFRTLFDIVLGDFQAYRRKGLRILFYNLVLSFGIQILRVLSVYTLALAVGLSPSFLEYTVIAPIMFLLILLPIPVVRLGWEQGIFIVMLGLIGVPTDAAFTMALINRLVLTATFIPGILCILSGWGLRKSSFFMNIRTKLVLW